MGLAIFILVLIVAIVLGAMKFSDLLRADKEANTEPEEVKTIYAWMDFWHLPHGNVWCWDVKGFNMDDEYTKSAFVRWYRKAASLEYYLQRKKV